MPQPAVESLTMLAARHQLACCLTLQLACWPAKAPARLSQRQCFEAFVLARVTLRLWMSLKPWQLCQVHPMDPNHQQAIHHMQLLLFHPACAQLG